MLHAQGERVSTGAGISDVAVVSSVVNSARGRVQPLDLMFVQTKRWAKVAALNVSWGILNDIKFAPSGAEAAGSRSPGAKVKRFLGQTSFSLARLLHVTSLRTHSAVLSYLPAGEEHARGGSRARSRSSSSCCSGRSSASSASSSATSAASPSSKRASSPQRGQEASKGTSPGCSCSRSPESTSCYTCSTCSLTDREHLYGRGGAATGSSEEEATTATEAGESSLEALLPGRRHKEAKGPPAAAVPPPPPVPTAATKYTYTSLLTEGQLYFRSWQELDTRLCNTGPFPILNSVPGVAAAKAKSMARAHAASSARREAASARPKRPKPFFPAMPEMPRPLPKEAGWVTEVGDFVAVHLLNLPFLDAHKCPVSECRPDDGLLWLVLVRAGVSRRELLRFLRALDAGQAFCPHAFAASGVEVCAVRGVRLAPLTAESVLTVDGEVLEDCDCLQAFVMPSVARTTVK